MERKTLKHLDRQMMGNKMDEWKTIEKIKTVCIPACDAHQGFFKVSVRFYWVCPVCGKPRGDIMDAYSFDGSRKLHCQGWENPCGHSDKYFNLREEAAKNGLNE